MTVNWTDSALSDLRAIEALIARTSTRYAQGVVDRIFAASAQLQDIPLLGAAVPEYDDESIRELLETPYRIVYRVLDDRIDVVAVVHSARRMPRTV